MMTINPFYAIGLLVSALTLTSCTAVPAPATGKSSVPCPSQDFRHFVVAFADSIPVQKAFVANTVRSESVDTNAKPEPKSVVRTVEASQLSFPLMPSVQQQVDEKLQMTLNIAGEDDATAKLGKEDTDYQMTFFFRKQGGCWKLYGLANDTL